MASSSTSRPRILLVGGVDLLDSVYPEDVGLPSDFACVVWFALLSLGCLLKMSAASAYASSLSINTIERKRYWNRTFAYCVTFAWQRVSFIVIPFCLSVCLSVSHSATYSLPRLIDHNQIWSAGNIPVLGTRVSLFGSPVSHTLNARGKNMQNFAYFQRAYLPLRDASCHMTCPMCRSVWKVYCGKTADLIWMPFRVMVSDGSGDRRRSSFFGRSEFGASIFVA